MEYYLRRTSKYLFRVSKFDGTKEPFEWYIVEYHFNVRPAKCNCWGFKRNKKCLHLRMVEKWYHMGCPIGGFWYLPETWDGEEEVMEFFSFPLAEGFFFTSKGGLTR